MGAIDALRCPHGCRPQAGPLDDSTALQLLTASLHAGGDTGALGTGPLPTPDDIARALQDPALASPIRNLLRSQTTRHAPGTSGHVPAHRTRCSRSKRDGYGAM